MALTKAKGNMYSWVTHVWSPIKGCQYECDYCYVKAYGYVSPRLQEKVLEERLGKGKTIFVGHLCDMWGPWISDDWIEKILNKCSQYPSNTYVFQSKNPGRFADFYLKIPFGSFLGTTIETDQYPDSFKTNAPCLLERASAMRRIKTFKKFVTIEPIMDSNVTELLNMILFIDPEFVTIGADSKGHGLIEPPWSKVEALIYALGAGGIEIRQKTNLERLKKG